MLLIYVGFDDTDSLTSAEGTGKMTRRFEEGIIGAAAGVGLTAAGADVSSNSAG